MANQKKFVPFCKILKIKIAFLMFSISSYVFRFGINSINQSSKKPNMQKGVKIGIIVAVIAVGVGLASPLFYETQVEEPLPVALNKIEEGLTYEKFASMDDEERKPLVENMPEDVKNMIMEKASTMTTSVSEEMDQESNLQILKIGEFEGLVGHHAEGIAKIIQVGDQKYLRFENFEVTNGPDLRVYITPDGDIKSGIHLDKLKGSKGSQNYPLEAIDTDSYDTVVIYCQPFGVYFGRADLT